MSLSTVSHGPTGATAPGAIPPPARRAPLERRLGAALLLMRASEAFRRLGFVRFGDYVVERLGVSPRTAQEMMRVEAALAALPRVAAAYDVGTITPGHVRLLTRVATPATEEFWVSLARRTGVRELAGSVAAAERAAAESEEGARATDGVGTGATDGDDDRGRAIVVEIRAPVSVMRLWRDTVALVRRVLGHAASAGECLEVVLAECAGAAGRGRDSGAVDVAGIRGDDGDQDSGASSDGAGGGTDLHASALLESGGQQAEALVAWSATTATAGGAVRPSERGASDPRDVDARALDADLRLLATERQRDEAALAEHLHAMGAGRRYRDEGFTSLEAYARERFEMSARHLYYLLALRRALARLPALRAAYLAGDVTARQARLVGSVATPATAVAWVRRAAGVTLRRLEDEVDLWRHLRDTGSPAWRLLRGGPLPAGLALAPGHAPRLHASAPPEATRFVRAMECDENAAAAAMPERTGILRLRLEAGVRAMWLDHVARCRRDVGDVAGGAGGDLEPWQALVLAMHDFWKTWDNVETRRQRRENPVLERDGWRCTAPACRALGTGRLQEHHVVFRSAGGGDDLSNRTTLCVGHHLGLLHEGLVRCSGRAPDELTWELGVERGRGAFLVLRGDQFTKSAAIG